MLGQEHAKSHGHTFGDAASAPTQPATSRPVLDRPCTVTGHSAVRAGVVRVLGRWRALRPAGPDRLGAARAGHEVLVASHPSDTDPIVRAGLPALPVGVELDMFALLRTRRRENLQLHHDGPDYRAMLVTAELVAAHLADDLVAYCRRWRPDLVIYEPAALVGPLVAAVLGVPAARQLWTCDFTAPVNGFPTKLSGPLTDRFGLAGLDPAGDLTLDPCPPRLQVVDDLPRQPIRYVPYNGPARAPDWLREPPAKRRIDHLGHIAALARPAAHVARAAGGTGTRRARRQGGRRGPRRAACPFRRASRQRTGDRPGTPAPAAADLRRDRPPGRRRHHHDRRRVAGYRRSSSRRSPTRPSTPVSSPPAEPACTCPAARTSPRRMSWPAPSRSCTIARTGKPPACCAPSTTPGPLRPRWYRRSKLCSAR